MKTDYAMRVLNGKRPMPKVKKFERSEFDALPERFLIGIDPGTKTGVGVWDRTEKGLLEVTTLSCILAQQFVLNYKCVNMDVCLIIEDARKRKWFGKNSEKKRQGAGSVKRDCKLWEEFCELEGIPYRLVHPQRGKQNTRQPSSGLLLVGRAEHLNTPVTRPCSLWEGEILNELRNR